MDKMKMRVVVIGATTPHDKRIFEKLRESLIGKNIVLDLNPIEQHVTTGFACGRLPKDSDYFRKVELDKSTKQQVGTYAAMFGVPDKTYVPDHKKKGKRK